MKIRNSPLMVLAIVVTVAVTVPALLKAHAKLQKTQPANGATVSVTPAQIQLSFDEAVDVTVSKIALTGPSATMTVALGSTKLMGPKVLVAPITGKMDDGTYTVQWQTTAADDGHVTKGDFKFTLKQAH